MYEDLSDKELLDIIVSELIECDAMHWLGTLTRTVELDAEDSEGITISSAIIAAAMSAYSARYPRQAVSQ